MPSFYPDLVFGWTFYGVLIGFLVVATYLDLGRLVIPKKVTLAMLVVGVVFSLVRGVWMGSVLEGNEEGKVVAFFAASPAWGALDGLLFALAGFAVGFSVFCGLWLLGVVGGGDVKLLAALGAWVGPLLIIYLIFGSVVVFLILGTVRLLQKVFRRGVQKTVFSVKDQARATNLKKTKAGARRRDQVLAYSLPVAIAAALMLPLVKAPDQPLLVMSLPNSSASVQR